LPADAADGLLTGSARTDYRYDEEFSNSQVDVWFDTRAYYRNWEGSARLRIHQTIGDRDDFSIEEIDRRHLAFVLPELSILAGNYYVTFGNGIILRTLEQRFITLNRVDRAFNLDRNLDGVRVRSETGPLRLTFVSGKPHLQELSGSGGATEIELDDLLQGGEGVLRTGEYLDLGFAYLLYETPAGSGDDRETEDFVSYRGQARWRALVGSLEYGEKRHRPLTPRGIARYARVEGGIDAVGVSLEWKSYRNFFFAYNELPTLVRTHESVLLNRATHVLLPDDERGIQTEIIYSPGLFTTALLNVSGSQGSDDNPGREFREVYLEGRTELEGRGGGRLGLDWARDRTKFPKVENRWTVALELEKFVSSEHAVILDIDLQAVETNFSEYSNQLLQLAYSRAGLLTAAFIAEHSTNRTLKKRDWFSGNLDVRLSQFHDITVWYGSRPAGIVCSGGFCFNSDAFEGFEARLLSRF
jgi:hypothetical protein